MEKGIIRKIIEKHYGLKRKITREEQEAEIADLRRGYKKGTLDDSGMLLKAKLSPYVDFHYE